MNDMGFTLENSKKDIDFVFKGYTQKYNIHEYAKIVSDQKWKIAFYDYPNKDNIVITTMHQSCFNDLLRELEIYEETSSFTGGVKITTYSIQEGYYQEFRENKTGGKDKNQLYLYSNSTLKKINRDPDDRKDFANVYWKKQYTLFDLITDEPIFPVNVNGTPIYKIYYSSNEDPNPYYKEFTAEQLENHLFYKFKTKENCMVFCNRKKKNEQSKINRDPDDRKDFANVYWKKQYTLFDLITDEPIFPVNVNGTPIYKIYYSSNEDPNPYYKEFTAEQLEKHRFYKFKNKENCMVFCNRKNKNEQSKINRDPNDRKDFANVYWKKQYTLFDLITDEPIFPVDINGTPIYKIYYSSNEDPNPYYKEFTAEQLEKHLFYKFKNKENCMVFCNRKKK